MLLPSPLPCEPPGPRPLLTRLGPYTSAQGSTRPSPLNPNNTAPGLSCGIQGTCRALQSLLGVQPVYRAPRPQITSKSIALPAGRVAKPLPAPSAKPALTPATPPRGANKRVRAVEEDLDELMDDASPAHDQENLGAVLPCSTPKRPRWDAPRDLPLGLERRDFYALQSTPGNAAAPRIPRTVPTPQPYPAGVNGDSEAEVHNGDHQDWDGEDDQALIALVLDKLRLSRSDWAECARILGTGGADSGRRLGQRWKHLVDDGKVGLRLGRGAIRPGRKRRGDVRELWQ